MSVERQLSHSLVSRLLLTVFIVIQSVLVTRILGPEGRGVYAKMQASLNFFILFLGIGLPSAITYFVANKKIAADKVLGLSFWVWVLGSLALGLFLLIGLIYPGADLFLAKGYSNTFFLKYLTLTFSLTISQMFFVAALSGRQKFIRANQLEVLVTMLRVLAFAVYLSLQYFKFWHPTLATFFVVDLVLTGSKFVLFLLTYIKEFGWRIRLQLNFGEVVRPVVGFSGLVYFSFLVSFIYFRLDYWLIEGQLGLVELGIYSVAATLAQFITLIPMTLNNVMLPHISSSEPQAMIQHLKYFSRINVAACGLVALAFVTLSGPLIHGFYGDAFAPAIRPLRILAVATLLLSIKHLFSYYNISQRRMRANIVGEVLGLAFGLSFNLVLIPKLGILGAAISALVGAVVSCLFVTVGVFWSWRSQLSPEPVREFFVCHVGDMLSLAKAMFRRADA